MFHLGCLTSVTALAAMSPDLDNFDQRHPEPRFIAEVDGEQELCHQTPELCKCLAQQDLVVRDPTWTKTREVGQGLVTQTKLSAQRTRLQNIISDLHCKF